MAAYPNTTNPPSIEQIAREQFADIKRERIELLAIAAAALAIVAAKQAPKGARP